jgi:hypothetical protein
MSCSGPRDPVDRGPNGRDSRGGDPRRRGRAGWHRLGPRHAEKVRSLVRPARYRPTPTARRGPARGRRPLREASSRGPVARIRVRVRVAPPAAGRTRPTSRGGAWAPVDRLPGGQLLADGVRTRRPDSRAGTGDPRRPPPDRIPRLHGRGPRRAPVDDRPGPPGAAPSTAAAQSIHVSRSRRRLGQRVGGSHTVQARSALLRHIFAADTSRMSRGWSIS